MRSRRAEISVFFAAVMLLVCALLFGIAESARLQSARLYLAVAANSSIESLFSQYHRELWDKYRLLGLEHYKDRQLRDELEGFIKPYFDARDMYPMSIDSILIKEKQLITDADGAVFDKELLDYMRYGIMLSAPSEEQLTEYVRCAGEAEGADHIYDGYYRRHIRAAMEIEALVEKIKQCLDQQRKGYEELVRGAEGYSLGAVSAACSSIQKELKRLPDMITEYNNQTIDFYEALLETEARIRTDRESGVLSETMYNSLMAEMNRFKEYFSSDNSRSGEINSLKEASRENIDYLDQVLELAELTEMEIRDYVSEHEGETPDIAALWEPVIDQCRAYRVLGLSYPAGVEDKEKTRRLEAIIGLRPMDILPMLLPEGVSISRNVPDMRNFPSAGREKKAAAGHGIIDRFYLAEYMGSFIDHYGRAGTADGEAFYGLEYILKGRNSSYDNLSAVVNELIAIRTGLNLMYLYSDNSKQLEAAALAAEITGATGFTPIAGIVKTLILAAWAYGQGLCDMRDLLHGKKVPFMHSAADYYLELRELLDIAVSRELKPQGDNTGGLEYVDYLKLMLIMRYKVIYSYRAMDMIQMDIATGQQDFLINRCASGLTAEYKVKAGYLFTRLGIFGGVVDKVPSGGYTMSITSSEYY